MRRLALALLTLAACSTSQEPAETAGITEAEEDRLVDACYRGAEDDPRCPGWVAAVIEYGELAGCDYRETSVFMAEMLSSPREEWTEIATALKC